MRRVYLGAMVGALASLGLAQPVLAADPVEPLNQYIVTGTDAELKALGALGHDMTEGAIAPGRTGIVATPSEADELEADGFDITPVGKELTKTFAAREADSPLVDPTWGYDVFRPYNLKPAPCQTTCSGAVDASGQPVSLRTYYDTLAAANPTLVKRVVYGKSLLGTDLVAYKVTTNANTTADGGKPGAMYHAAQHAREWISAEVVRRGYQFVVENSGNAASGVPAILASTELWFIPVLNPDGYDYTFQNSGTRQWRKTLRDNNNDGLITNQDGVDPNRNFSEKWRYDNEGSSGTLSSASYRGTEPESESEVKSFHELMARIKPEFYIDYHSFANLVLYPVGWQVETYGGDSPLMEALAGTDRTPAVAGYDPDVGAELYTTNGEVTDTMYLQHGILGYTIELDGGSGAAVGGTKAPGSTNPSGFVFQDREADIEAVWQKNKHFMLDLAKSAATPDQPSSHIGAKVPDFVPAAFGTSYGTTSQTVEVNTRRALGDVTVKWQVNNGAVLSGPTTEFDGGERYGESGVYFHRMRGSATGFKPGDSVKVWFEAGGKSSDPFTFTASALGTGKQVLVLSAEDYSGTSPNAAPTTGPNHLSTYLEALGDAGIPADVYDFDAQGRNLADLHGVLGHYKAVIWYTGNDDFVRDPGQTTGVSKVFDDQIIAVRDFLNEGGKVLIAGQRALHGAWSAYSYNPLGRVPAAPQCSNTGNAAGQLENCVQVSNDFMQYWMGANARANVATTEANVLTRTITGAAPFSAAFGLTGQSYLGGFTPTSTALPPAQYPWFASSKGTHAISGATTFAGVSTDDTLLWGFGLENVADRAKRKSLVFEGMKHLGVNPYTQTTGNTGGSVPATLSLTLGDAASFGPFTPGVDRDYESSTTANVISTAGDAALTVSEPGHLTNGAFSLAEPLRVSFSKSAWTGPTSNETVNIAFKQLIKKTDPLRTGAYSKTLTFTLSTTQP